MLNYEEIKKNPQKITKLKPFINTRNWQKTNFPLEKDNWKKFEENDIIIALNVLYAKKEKSYPTYVSKHNSKRETQVTLLMISNGSKRKSKSEWCEAKSEGQCQLHYLAIKKLSALLRGITSKHYGDFYCLNCVHSYRTKNKLESYKNVCENIAFWR